MKYQKDVLAIVLATLWISASEFFRNNVLLKSDWVNHYKDLGLAFPDKSANGAIWGLWSLLFATAIYVVARQLGLIQTTLICWFMAFVMMWVTIGNLNVLPYRTIWFAIPLSLFETFVAVRITKRTARLSKE